MPEHAKNSMTRKTWIQTGIAVFVIAAVAAGLIYWLMQNARVYVDTATIEAPLVDLSATQDGQLQKVFVNEGDTVAANTPVAQVGDELVSTKEAGIVVSLPDTIGAQISAGTPVAEMIDPTQLRVVGKVDENKGLANIAVGDPVTFTVDAFGSRTFTGVVDEVAPTSEATSVVFNISDTRQTSQFDVKVRFDTNEYPELKNGMSARMWVYTQ